MEHLQLNDDIFSPIRSDISFNDTSLYSFESPLETSLDVKVSSVLSGTKHTDNNTSEKIHFSTNTNSALKIHSDIKSQSNDASDWKNANKDLDCNKKSLHKNLNFEKRNTAAYEEKLPYISTNESFSKNKVCSITDTSIIKYPERYICTKCKTLNLPILEKSNSKSVGTQTEYGFTSNEETKNSKSVASLAEYGFTSNDDTASNFNLEELEKSIQVHVSMELENIRSMMLYQDVCLRGEMQKFQEEIQKHNEEISYLLSVINKLVKSVKKGVK